MRFSLRLGIVLIMCALLGFAQADANKAQIIGTVVDPNSAVVPNAQITLKNTATGALREATSDGTGGYRVGQLDPGPYEILARAPGFAVTTLTGVTLSVGSAINVEIKLQVSSTTTTIDVAETLVNVAMPAPSTVITSTQIANLPINGRRFQDFATLTPTVQIDPSRSQISFAGQRGINSNIMLDGADYNQPFFGGIRGGERSNFNFTVPQGAVQEFQAVPSGYTAEYGRSTGGVLNVITKSGTNDIHGEGFYQNRNSALSMDSPIPFLNPITNQIEFVQPSESLQQWGGNAGGPVKRDKLFLFGAYEQQTANTPAAVVFANLAGIVPTAATKDAYDFFQSQQVPFTRENSAIATTVKADYNFSSGSRLTARFNWSNSNEPNSVTVGGALNPFTNLTVSNEGTEKNRIYFGTMQLTSVFTPTVVNDIRFSGSYEERPRLANAELPTVGASIIGTFGSRNFLPTTQNDSRYQITDSLVLNAGKHTIKVGGDLNFLSTYQSFGFNQFGAFSLAGSNVNTLLQILSTGPAGQNRFDNSAVTYNRQIGNLIADYGAQQVSLFAQDSWRVTPRFTLDIGFRWEGQWNPAVDASNAALADKVNAVIFPIGAQLNVKTIPDTINQYMPRIGFAWTPFAASRGLVIRGFSGMFYASTPQLLYSGATNNFRLPPGDVSLQLAPTATMTVYQQLLAAGVDLNKYPLGNLPIIPVATVQQASAIANGGAARDPFLGAALTTMAPNYENPRSWQNGIGIEGEMARNFVAGAQFLYVNTVHLERNRDYNLPAPVVRATDASQRPFFGLRSGTARPLASQAAITVRESSARSLYRAMLLSAQYRGKRFTGGMNYTLSTNYSDDDNERDSGGMTAQNSFNFIPDYNYSNLDNRHTFAVYGVVNLPWGFEFSGIYRVRSGLPLNPLTGADTNEDLFTTDRPYTAPGITMLRNSYRNRAVMGDDLRLLKTFTVKDRYRIQLSAEVFNFMNIDNVIFSGAANTYGAGLQPNGTVAALDPRFMRLKTADGLYDRNNRQVGNPLQAQFGIRFFF